MPNGFNDYGNNLVTVQNTPSNSQLWNQGFTSSPNFLPELNIRNNFSPLTNNPSMVGGVTGGSLPSGSNNMRGLLGLAGAGISGLASAGAIMPALGFGMAGAGLLSSFLNKPKDINQDFSFDLSKSEYNPNSDLTGSIGNLNRLGKDFRGAYRNMLNPSSSYNQRMFQNLRRNVGDTREQTIGNINAAMAARGMMGMGNLYDAITNRTAGDQYPQGMQGIMNTSLGMAGQFGQLASGAYGQSGNLAGQIDARTLQNAQVNAQNQNTYNQYLKTSNYNQAVQNQNAQSSWGNNMTNNLFGLAGSFFGGA